MLGLLSGREKRYQGTLEGLSKSYADERDAVASVLRRASVAKPLRVSLGRLRSVRVLPVGCVPSHPEGP